MSKITVIGNTIADLSFDLPPHYLHQAAIQSAITLPFGSKLPAQEYHVSAGGSGANVAVGLKKGGIETHFITGLSTDVFGEFLRKVISETGLVMDADIYKDSSNLSVVLRIKAERTIITVHSPNYHYLDSKLPETGWIHVGPLPPEEDKFYERLISHVVKTGQPFSLNPDMGILEARTRQFLLSLRQAKLVFLNQEEAAILTRLPKRTSPEDLTRAVNRMGIEIACVTAGEKGAFVGSSLGIFFVPALTPVGERLDTTGAGDSFTTGFLIGYLDSQLTEERKLIEQAIIFGSLNAASVVSKVGGQAGLLTKAELARDAGKVTLRKVGDD